MLKRRAVTTLKGTLCAGLVCRNDVTTMGVLREYNFIN